MARRSLISGLNATDVTRSNPCGRSILVFNIQNPVLGSHHQIFKYTSPRKASSPSRLSTVAIHSPEDETTAHSTRGGSKGASSRRETLFVGDTSNSPISIDVDGAYVWREEGCEDGRIRVDVAGWMAIGTQGNVDELLYEASGPR